MSVKKKHKHYKHSAQYVDSIAIRFLPCRDATIIRILAAHNQSPGRNKAGRVPVYHDSPGMDATQ